MTPRTRYGFFVLISAITSAISLVLTEVVIRHFQADAVLVAVLGNITGGSILVLAAYRDGTSIRIPRRRRLLVRLVAAAFCTYTLAYLLSFYAISLIGSGKEALLGQLESVFVVFLAVFFLGEYLSIRRWLAGVLALAGAVVINFDPQALRLTFGLGEVLAVLAPLGFATGIILLKPLLDIADARWITGVALLIGALFLVPLVPVVVSSFELGLAALLMIASIGLMRGIAWLTYNMSLPHIGASRCAIIFLSFAFFTVLLQAIVSQAAPGLGLQVPDNLLMAVLGGVMVAAGIVILETDPSPLPAEEIFPH